MTDSTPSQTCSSPDIRLIKHGSATTMSAGSTTSTASTERWNSVGRCAELEDDEDDDESASDLVTDEDFDDYDSEGNKMYFGHGDGAFPGSAESMEDGELMRGVESDDDISSVDSDDGNSSEDAEVKEGDEAVADDEDESEDDDDDDDDAATTSTFSSDLHDRGDFDATSGSVVDRFTNKSKYKIPSLFPDGPSVLYFPSPDEPATILPRSLEGRLILRSCKYTPSVVKEVVRRAGMKVVKGPLATSKLSRKEPWLLYWGRHIKTEQFRNVEPFQIINHAPNSFEIGRKDRLAKSLKRMYQVKPSHHKRMGSTVLRPIEAAAATAAAKRIVPSLSSIDAPSTTKSRKKPNARVPIDFLPTTFILPQDRKQLKRAFKEARHEARVSRKPEKAVWIIKPPASARGIGVRLVKKWSEVPKRKDAVVCRYVHNPLLVEGRKFDLRL